MKTSMREAGFALDHLRYGSLVNPASSVWRVGGYYLTMDFAMSSSLYGKLVVLQCKAAFSISYTVSATLKNTGGKFYTL